MDWSDRAKPQVRDAGLPGPDGIDSIAPLVRTGMVNPLFVNHVAATFTGGFKRYHGAFRSGEFSLKSHGTHYGFVENGVILSKLQEGLATVIIDAGGQLDMKTWTAQDAINLETIRYARQNGLPLIEPGPDGLPQPGKLVSQPLIGNWSGSQDGRYRTGRVGHPGVRWQPLSAGFLFLHGHRHGHGPGVSGLPRPICHAVRHQRPGAHLPGPVSARRHGFQGPAPDQGHGRSGQNHSKQSSTSIHRIRR